MQRRKWTTDQRDQAVALLAQHGAAEAARRTGIPAGTIGSWATRGGMRRPTQPAELTQAIADRKARLAAGLLDDVDRLRRDLFAPTIERRALVVGGGYREASMVEVVDVDHPTTSAVERKATMTAIAIAVDKVLLLTGDATERIETLTGHTTIEDEALVVVDELAARRAS